MAASMMLDYLGEKSAAAEIEKAVFDVLSEGKVRTADLGGFSTTSQMSEAVASKISEF
jgi:isocitrate/isopropylmalate dehydrogenase